MAWTDEMVKDLKKMWKDGMTTGEIGKRLGISKNSVVGKVHRLNLEGRPSPIKKKADKPAKPAPKPIVAPTPAPKAEKAAPKPVVAPVIKKPEPVAPQKPAEKTSFTQEREMSAPIIYNTQHKSKDGKVNLTNLDNHTCRWPIGDPKDESFHFCGKKTRLGNTYCDEHSAIAYVRTVRK